MCLGSNVHLPVATPRALLESNGDLTVAPVNPEKAPRPTYPRTTTSKPLHMDSGSEATQRRRITKKKSEPCGFRSQQSKQNDSIRVGLKKPGGGAFGPEPGLGGPPCRLGSRPLLSAHDAHKQCGEHPTCWPTLPRTPLAMLLRLTFTEFLHSLG